LGVAGTASESAAKTASTAASRRNRDRAARAEIAIGKAQRVKAKERNFVAKTVSHVGDQLVLLEDSTGVVLVDVVVVAERRDAAGRICPRQRRVGIAQEQLMNSA
jgi:hypothetical protein